MPRLLDAPRVRAALLAACAGQVSCAHLSTPAEPGPGGRDVALRFEGSCVHLACCSSYAVPVRARTIGAFPCDGTASACRRAGWFVPGFTCDPYALGRYRQPHDPPYLGCNDSERWLSLPGLSQSRCGERLLVCHRGVRVTAAVRDRSAPNNSGRTHYEGSLGLLRAIGADPGARETSVSVYALAETDRIAADPQCVGE